MARRKPLPQALPIEIRTLDDEGLGRTEFEARDVRVRNALPGEKVVAQIHKRRRGVWYGNALEVAIRSSDRRSAPCSVFPRCGGCSTQHVRAEAQLAAKQAQLLALLDSQGVVPISVRNAVTGPQFAYRRKARLGVRRVGDQVFVGFREAFGGRVVDMTACETLDGRLAAMVAPLRQLICGLTVANQVPQVELAAGDASVALVLRHLEPLTTSDIHKLREFSERHRVQLLTQDGGYDSVRPLPEQEPTLLDYALPEHGLVLQFSPTDFTQVNAHINAKLIRTAVDALRQAQRVGDLFCGIGNFSLALARAGKVVHGLESSEPAVARARLNARLNALDHRLSFAVSDLYGDDSDGPDEGCDALLLDPPRSGAGPRLESWLNAGVSQVVYVSCGPKSFAADAKVLQDRGFRLEEVGVFDMFPQTTHVETLGVFRR